MPSRRPVEARSVIVRLKPASLTNLVPALMAPHDDTITSETITRGRSRQFSKKQKKPQKHIDAVLKFVGSKKKRIPNYSFFYFVQYSPVQNIFH